MSAAVITYHCVMGRWEPNARGRLAKAALTLYAEQGFEQTTAAAMAGALRDRGIPEPAASLAAETGIVVYRVTFARWIGGQAQPGLPELLRESVEELRDVLADRLTSTSALSEDGGVAVVVNAPVTGSAHDEAAAPPRCPCGRAKASAARRSPLAAARWLAQALPPGHASPR